MSLPKVYASSLFSLGHTHFFPYLSLAISYLLTFVILFLLPWPFSTFLMIQYP